MRDRNLTVFDCNIGADPVVRYTAAGQAVCNFSGATNEFYKNKEGKLTKITTWRKCVVWGKQAEVVGKMCQKGTKVSIDGKVRNNSYTNKEGVVIRFDEVKVDAIRFLAGTKGKAVEPEGPTDEQPDEQPENPEQPTAEPAKPLDTRDLVF
jgi:single-strand DNA-binding protein